MRIVVTGGSGFIGTNYINHLLKNEDAKILNIDKNPPKNSSHLPYWRECNILDAEKTKEVVKSFNPDYLVHLAATVRTDLFKLKEFRENIEGVENVLEACRNAENLKRVIFTSTFLVCQVGHYPQNDTDYKPNTVYGKSKVMGEELVREAKNLPFQWTIVRPISIWGPWSEKPYMSFFKAVMQGWYFHIGSGQYERSLGYIGNTVKQIHAIVKADQELVDSKTFYLADPEPTNLHEMAELIREKSDAKKIYRLPLFLAKSLAKIGDLLQKAGWKNVPITSFRLNNITTEYVYDLSPTMELSNFEIIDVNTGVEETLQYIHDNK